MSFREAATIWMSNRAMKKPTHMTAKAKIFRPSESSPRPGAAGAGAGVEVARPGDVAEAGAGVEVARPGAVAEAGGEAPKAGAAGVGPGDGRVSMAMAL